MRNGRIAVEFVETVRKIPAQYAIEVIDPPISYESGERSPV
jgi:hypothetical protein